MLFVFGFHNHELTVIMNGDYEQILWTVIMNNHYERWLWTVLINGDYEQHIMKNDYEFCKRVIKIIMNGYYARLLWKPLQNKIQTHKSSRPAQFH